MGVCYVLSCKQCKKMIDLDKNRAVTALFYDSPIPEGYEWQDVAASFRFMRRHWGHDVGLHSDHDDGDEYSGSFNYEEEFRI